MQFNSIITELEVKKISFETRAGIMLTVYGGIALILLEKVKIKSILDCFITPLNFIILTNVLSGIVVYILFIVALVLLSMIISVDKYKNFDIHQINEQILGEDNYVGATKLVVLCQEKVQVKSGFFL